MPIPNYSKILGHFSFAIFAVCVPSIVVSQTKADIAARCITAIEAGDTTAAASLSFQISQWKRIFSPSTISSAEICLNSTGVKYWKYSNRKGAFLSGEEARSELDIEANELAQTNKMERARCQVLLLTNEVARLLAESRDIVEAQSAELFHATSSACENGYEKNPDATLLKPICNDIFRKTGLPDSKYPSNATVIATAQGKLALAKLRLLKLKGSDVSLAKREQTSDTQKCIDLLEE